MVSVGTLVEYAQAEVSKILVELAKSLIAEKTRPFSALFSIPGACPYNA
jgi:hypothetical protein